MQIYVYDMCIYSDSWRNCQRESCKNRIAGKPFHTTMADSTENATPPGSTKSRFSNSSVQTQIQQQSQREFVLWDTEESELLDLVDFGGVAFSVETVIDILYCILSL